MNDTRQHAHQHIDRLPEIRLSGLVQFLETIVDQARDWLENNGGNGIPHAEAMRRLGLA